MAEFAYIGTNQQGIEVRGKIEASNQKQARERLISQNVNIVSVKKESEYTWEELFSKNNRKINSKDILLFTKYFGVLCRAGIPVLKSLVILEKQTENIRFKKRVKKIREGVEAGSSLSDCFGKYEDIFSNMYLNLIRIGEESGMLFEMLEKLNNFLTKSETLKKKVKSALVYPSVIAFVAGGVVIFLMSFVIPRFIDIFASFKTELPLATRIVIGISNFFQNYLPILIGASIAFFIIFSKFKSTDFGKKVIDKIMLKLPLVGNLVTKYAVNVYCANLSVLLKSGVSISHGLEVANQSIDNSVIHNEFEIVRDSVEGGASIGDSLERSPSIPDMVAQMISVGDQTGTLEDMLQNVADYYEEEVDGLVDALTSLIEPMFILFLGVVVGGIVISMFMPMFQMGKAVSG